MPLSDRRNLPAPVAERLAEAGLLDGYGVRARGCLVEAGWQQRGRPAGIRLEARDVAEGDPAQLDGYAAVWDVAYPVMGGKDSAYGWDETIVRGAVDKSLAEQDDVYLLFDHEGLPVASTKAGSLRLSSDRVGLLVNAQPDMRSQWNSEVVMRVRSGEIDAMSWAFTAGQARSQWNDDYTERFITEARMWDVSAVKWPANEATHIMGRAQLVAVAASAMPLSLARAQLDRLRSRRMDSEDLGALAEMIGLGTEYIAEQDEPGDEANIPVMEDAIKLIASLVQVEIDEDEPVEDETE
jgi:HK97 family phage prohead protease